MWENKMRELEARRKAAGVSYGRLAEAIRAELGGSYPTRQTVHNWLTLNRKPDVDMALTVISIIEEEVL